MFRKEVESVAQAAADKVRFLNENPTGYFASSLLAGMFIGFGILLSFTIGAMGSMPLMKLFMGMSFACALSLVIMAGAELFTGNNLVMAAGFLENTVSAKDVLKLWVICYVGNWIGSILLAWIFAHTGLMTEAFCAAVAPVAAAKVSIPFGALLLRATLCNMLVCLAVWCSIKMTSESGKLIMVFWIIVIFFTAGFEHSVANMVLLSLDFMAPGTAMTMGSYFYNILTATLGNMIGGIFFVAVPYTLMAKK
ncbi:formate/nitrite transporter family protein [Peptoniphilus sp. EMRHCC_23]|uniref:formate/nitrite transporter family protein n=1 Tax=Peptoniphilus rachelemmaiella TaxID=2811779 RepID=UPI001C002A80|nr:formate/nitrite transporter family protein [Peptoniphilus rachelemmaiella]